MDSKEKLLHVSNELIAYLQELVTRFEVNESELRQVVGFLTRVGQQNEFQLLFDVLGISVLVDDITHGLEQHSTAHNVEGPLYRAGVPLRTPPVILCQEDEEGDILFISGQVTAAGDGRPLVGAMLDVWQTNRHGYYENQDTSQPEYNLRGRLLTGEQGRFEFRTIVPGAYEVTRSGPVADLLLTLGRHGWRPSHMHVKVSCDGFVPLTTMLFMPGDPWLQSDAINAVKESLIVKFEKHESQADMRERGVDRPFYTCRYDFSLNPASA